MILFKRIAIPILLTALILMSDHWMPRIFAMFVGESFQSLGTLRTQPTSSADTADSIVTSYKINIKSQLSDSQSNFESLSIGFGRVFGQPEVYCSKNSDSFQLYSDRLGPNKADSAGHAYITVSFPTQLCDTVEMRVVGAKGKTIGAVGWRNGQLVIGPTRYINSYKFLADFFASYIRVLISIISLLLLFSVKQQSKHTKQAYSLTQVGVGLLSVQFLAASGLLENLVPGFLVLGFPLLKATAGVGFLVLAIAHLKLPPFETRTHSANSDSKQFWNILIATGLAMAFYYAFPGKVFLVVQGLLSVALLSIGVVRNGVFPFISGLFLGLDVLSITGLISGIPSNFSVHFTLLYFIQAKLFHISWSRAINLESSNAGSISKLNKDIAAILRVFGVHRASYNYFDTNSEFILMPLIGSFKSSDPKFGSAIPSIAASVITSKMPILRASRNFASLHADQRYAGSKGSEFCVFPMTYLNRTIGTINFTSYPSASLSDAIYLSSLNETMDIVSPQMANCLYQKHSNSISREIDLVEHTKVDFMKQPKRDVEALERCLTKLANLLDMKVILSRRIPGLQEFETFICANYMDADAKFLQSHNPKLDDNLITSPANLAYVGKQTIFIPEVKILFPIYPPFLVQLLERNFTSSLFVQSLTANLSNDEWGIIWLEFQNKQKIDLNDLENLSKCIKDNVEQLLNEHYSWVSQEKINEELFTLVPLRLREKLAKGLSIREQEEGYILNIDLIGSTGISKSIGETLFRELMKDVTLKTSQSLGHFGFEHQLNIWDALIFTRPSSFGPISKDDPYNFEQTLKAAIDSIKGDRRFSASSLGFRAVLHRGDITRDFSGESSKAWTITGNALAESCKIESANKSVRNQVIISPVVAQELKEAA